MTNQTKTVNKKLKSPATAVASVSGLKLGSKAPVISLLDQSEQKHTLKDFLGQWIVLFFYPKDMTPGCTVEAQEFAELYKQFERLNCRVLGISPDSSKSHEKFALKYNLPFPLLADIDHKVAEKYAVWVEKSMYGRKYMGILRSTFLINQEGKIQENWLKVSPKGHAAQVLTTLREIL